MPGRKHLRGVGATEQLQYEHIQMESAESERYGWRTKEVAAGNEDHKEEGHKEGTDFDI